MRRSVEIFLASLAVASCLGAAGSARAGVVVFTSRAEFATASTNLQAVDFEGVPSGPVFGVLTLNGVGFSGINGVLPVVAPDFGYTGPGTALLNIGVPEVSGIGATLPGGITAVGTDLLAIAPDNRSPVVVTLSTGETFTFGGDPLPARQFVGFTTDAPVAFLEIRSNSQSAGTASRIGIDDFVFGQAQAGPIPEPSAVVMFGIGLAAMAAAVRRRCAARRDSKRVAALPPPAADRARQRFGAAA